MTLNELKIAAKRLRKQHNEVCSQDVPMTYSQALDAISREQGFRHFHEARARLSSDERRWALGIVGPSGCGKTLKVQELIVGILAKGGRVRMVDAGGSYRHFVQALGGQYFDGEVSSAFLQAWASSAPLVMLDDMSRLFAPKFSFDELGHVPADAVFVCDEVYFFRNGFRALTNRTVMVAQVESDLPLPVTRRLQCTLRVGWPHEWRMVDSTGSGVTAPASAALP